MEYRLANGSAITDEDIERECAEYESGSWEGSLVNFRVGRPRLSEVEANANLSFKCPKTGAALSMRSARAGCGSRSSCARPRSKKPRGYSGRHSPGVPSRNRRCRGSGHPRQPWSNRLVNRILLSRLPAGL